MGILQACRFNRLKADSHLPQITQDTYARSVYPALPDFFWILNVQDIAHVRVISLAAFAKSFW